MFAKLVVIICFAMYFFLTAFFAKGFNLSFIDFWFKAGLLWFLIAIFSAFAVSWQTLIHKYKNSVRLLASPLVFALVAFAFKQFFELTMNWSHMPSFVVILLAITIGVLAQTLTLNYLNKGQKEPCENISPAL